MAEDAAIARMQLGAKRREPHIGPERRSARPMRFGYDAHAPRGESDRSPLSASRRRGSRSRAAGRSGRDGSRERRDVRDRDYRDGSGSSSSGSDGSDSDGSDSASDSDDLTTASARGLREAYEREIFLEEQRSGVRAKPVSSHGALTRLGSGGSSRTRPSSRSPAGWRPSPSDARPKTAVDAEEIVVSGAPRPRGGGGGVHGGGGGADGIVDEIVAVCPEGSREGDELLVALPSGMGLVVTRVPAGVDVGDEFTVRVRLGPLPGGSRHSERLLSLIERSLRKRQPRGGRGGRGGRAARRRRRRVDEQIAELSAMLREAEGDLTRAVAVERVLLCMLGEAGSVEDEDESGTEDESDDEASDTESGTDDDEEQLSDEASDDDRSRATSSAARRDEQRIVMSAERTGGRGGRLYHASGARTRRVGKRDADEGSDSDRSERSSADSSGGSGDSGGDSDSGSDESGASDDGVIEIVCPSGMRAGDVLEVRVPDAAGGGTRMVRVPSGIRPGEAFDVYM